MDRAEMAHEGPKMKMRKFSEECETTMKEAGEEEEEVEEETEEEGDRAFQGPA